MTFNRRNRKTDLSTVTYPVIEISHRLDTVALIEGDPGKSVVRTDNNKIISNVSTDYQIVRHADIIELVEAVFLKNKIAYELFDVHLGGNKGNQMYVDYILPDQTIEINGDIYKPFVQIQNSYDKSLMFGSATGLYREVCSNGLMLGKRVNSLIRRKHYESISIIDVVLDMDEWFKSIITEIKPRMEKLVTRNIAPAGIDVDEWVSGVLNKIFDRKSDIDTFQKSNILSSYTSELGHNQYALLNALTDYTTHVVEEDGKIRSYDLVQKTQSKLGRLFLDVNINDNPTLIL
jgi:hypothetical protein